MQNSNNDTNWKYIIGAGIGLAAGLYANSDKGRAHRQIAAELAQEKGEMLRVQGTEYISKANQVMHELRNKGAQYLAAAKLESTEAQIEINDFVEQEMAVLKSKLNKKLDSIKNSVNSVEKIK